MTTFNKDLVLNEIPLFAPLCAEEKEFIRKKISFRTYKKGQIVYREGDPPDAFYCIVLGRILIYTCDRQGKETVLEYLHRGKYFGIISLLTHDPHSVTAKAINDCTLLVVTQADFDIILDKIPRLAIDLSQTLSRRLKRKDIHPKIIFESSVISVFSSYSQVGKTIYAINLALGLQQETHKSVLIVDIVPEDKKHSLPQKLEVESEFPIFDVTTIDIYQKAQMKDFILTTRFDIDLLCVIYKPEDEMSVSKMIDTINLLVNDYHYIVLDLPAQMDLSIFDILNQSDEIHVLSSPDGLDLERTHNLIDRLIKEFCFQLNKIKVIVNEYKFAKLTHEQQLETVGHSIFATLPKIEFASSDRLILEEADSEYARVVKRIARQMGERQVGVALGVGVAYGFCHIGVLRVIEEEKIPIDIIAGSSMGALVASLWATGRSSQEILEITKEFKEPKSIWGVIDLTFPWKGFIKGNKLYQFLRRYLGNKSFYDVKLPLKIVTSNVRRREIQILDKGLLIDAVMASCAMPGVFLPFRSKEELLLDGGVVQPLPTEILFNMGIRKIIAVNVTPSREDILRQYEKIKEEMSLKPSVVKKIPWFNFRQRLRERFHTNILDIIFSSVELMQSEMAQREAEFADIVLHPDMHGLFWLEVHKADEFARRGEAEARKNVDRIWQVINE
jgi:NTE family protein